MKFFVVILAVIGIESIGNCAGQDSDSAENDISITLNDILDAGSKVLQAYRTSMENNVRFLMDVNEGDLVYVMELKLGDEVVVAGDEKKPREFCEESLEADILRSTLLPETKISCPVKKGEYTIYYPYEFEIKDTARVKQMKCGEYTGLGYINDRSGKLVYAMEVHFYLDERDNGCIEE